MGGRPRAPPLQTCSQGGRTHRRMLGWGVAVLTPRASSPSPAGSARRREKCRLALLIGDGGEGESTGVIAIFSLLLLLLLFFYLFLLNLSPIRQIFDPRHSEIRAHYIVLSTLASSLIFNDCDSDRLAIRDEV